VPPTFTKPLAQPPPSPLEEPLDELPEELPDELDPLDEPLDDDPELEPELELDELEDELGNVPPSPPPLLLETQLAGMASARPTGTNARTESTPREIEPFMKSPFILSGNRPFEPPSIGARWIARSPGSCLQSAAGDVRSGARAAENAHPPRRRVRRRAKAANGRGIPGAGATRDEGPRMRVVALGVFVMLAGAPLGACSSDGTDASLPHGRGALFGGGGSPGEGASGSSGAPAGSGAAGGDQPVASDAPGGAQAPVVGAGGTDAAAPTGAAASESDASADAEPAKAADAASAAAVAGCACGCADPCLTELITACKAPTAALLLVCPKVPAACACETNCAAVPAAPSLDTCIAQFLLTGT
jgi:hypothetical protein